MARSPHNDFAAKNLREIRRRCIQRRRQSRGGDRNEYQTKHESQHGRIQTEMKSHEIRAKPRQVHRDLGIARDQSRGDEIAQYRAGGVDFIRVLNATQFLLQEQQNLVITRINVATSAISLNKALGGGWELRKDGEFVPAQTIEEMRKRTNWGNITSTDYGTKKDMLLFARPKTSD